MTFKKIIVTAALAACLGMPCAAVDSRLSGTIIGSPSSDSNGGQIDLVNTRDRAFDGDVATHYRAYVEDWSYSRPWIGLDLGEPHVITKIGFCPRPDRAEKTVLSVFQGANRADFSDAMPIAMVREAWSDSRVHYIPVDVSRGFRYVRMVSAPSAACNVAELEFYGHPGEGDDSRFFQVSNLPTVAFNTPGMEQIMSKDDKKKGSTVYVIAEDGTYLLSDDNAQMKGRGNASWTMDKKPFQIKFDKKQRILPDAPAKAKKWTLINNHGDKTLMRNKIAFEMSRLAGIAYTPYCRFVDVIYNGEYEGCYQLCDQVEVNPGRVEVTEMTPEDTAGENLTGGYLIEVDAYADQEKSWFRSRRGTPVTIKSPDEDEITPAQTKYITDFYNSLEDAVFSRDFTDPEIGFRKYIDIQSLINYFIVGELDGNPDQYWSTYMYKDRNDPKLHVGPIWDVDLGFDNDNRHYPIDNKRDYLYLTGSVAGENFRSAITRMVLTDSGSKKALQETWSRLREYGNFTSEYFSDRIDEWSAEIDESQQLNFRRWNILNTLVHQNPRALGSFKAEVEAVKDYLTKRFARLDSFIGRVPVSSGVDEVETAPATKVRYITPSGLEADPANLTPGIYIRLTPKGAEKIVVR